MNHRYSKKRTSCSCRRTTTKNEEKYTKIRITSFHSSKIFSNSRGILFSYPKTYIYIYMHFDYIHTLFYGPIMKNAQKKILLNLTLPAEYFQILVHNIWLKIVCKTLYSFDDTKWQNTYTHTYCINIFFGIVNLSKTGNLNQFRLQNFHL